MLGVVLLMTWSNIVDPGFRRYHARTLALLACVVLTTCAPWAGTRVAGAADKNDKNKAAARREPAPSQERSEIFDVEGDEPAGEGDTAAGGGDDAPVKPKARKPRTPAGQQPPATAVVPGLWVEMFEGPKFGKLLQASAHKQVE